MTLANSNSPAIMLPLGLVAQLVEQRIENPCVGGSIPPRATKNSAVNQKNANATFGWRFALLDRRFDPVNFESRRASSCPDRSSSAYFPCNWHTGHDVSHRDDQMDITMVHDYTRFIMSFDALPGGSIMFDKIDWGFITAEEGDWSVGYVPNVKNPKSGRINSGTTIVSGFDLGQQTKNSLLALNLSPALTNKLLPYIGIRGAEAVMAAQRQFESSLKTLNALNGSVGGPEDMMKPLGIMGGRTGPLANRDGSLRTPKEGRSPTHFIAGDTILGLQLDQSERNELIPAIRRLYYDKLAEAYNLAAPLIRFQSLQVGVQTALVSLSWHTGGIWRQDHNAYDVFTAAVRQNWRDVADALRAGPIFYLPKYSKFRARRRAEAALVIQGTNLEPYQMGPKERKMFDYLERGSRTA